MMQEGAHSLTPSAIADQALTWRDAGLVKYPVKDTAEERPHYRDAGSDEKTDIKH